MEHKLLEKIYGNLTYSEYQKLDKIKTIIFLILYFSSPFTKSLEKLFLSQSIAEILLALNIFHENLVMPEKYTKDIREINIIYHEIIKNYDELNKTFNFNNPEEIYAMFQYLLWEGYLSKDKHFEYNKENHVDIRNLTYGPNIVTGYGVCRHIAIFLKDIYKHHQIDTFTLAIYQPNIENILLQTLVEKNKKDLPKEMYQELYKLIKQSKKNKKTSNHLITGAVHEGRSYFLDPTNRKVYQKETERILSEKARIISMNEDIEENYIDDELLKIQMEIFPKASMHYNPDKRLKQLKKILELPSISPEEIEASEKRVIEICETNLDIFEKFYQHNQEAYQELSNKLNKIKVKKKIK